jgi:decaprenylphospho-beta-D-erythro-pentofuranosid-2-ulose 2-reductase
MRKMLIIGATSAIAEATARLFAVDAERFYLVVRNSDRLDAVARDLRIRGAVQVETQVMDANNLDEHAAMIERAIEALGGLNTVLIAHGTLPDQRACEKSTVVTLSELQTNCLSIIALLTRLANHFEQQQHGTLAVISSVAGDRGRQSNYVYGTAKAAVSTFLQGLRNRLHRSGVQVLTIKPGFVDTPMTAQFKKGLLWAKPGAIAKRIHKSIGKNIDVIYLPWFWRFIMLVVRYIPENLFKRLKL